MTVTGNALALRYRIRVLMREHHIYFRPDQYSTE